MIAVLRDYAAAWTGGLAATLLLFALTVVIGTVGGVLLAALSRIGAATAVFVRAFNHAMMALPVLVILIWVFYALPAPPIGVTLSPIQSAATALGLSLAAFVADIFINGMSKVPRGQVEAAQVLLGGDWPAFRYVVAPQTVRLTLVPLLGQYVTALKFTSLAAVVGAPELLHTAGDVIQRTYRPLEVYSSVALLFILLVVPLNVGVRAIEARLQGSTRP